MRADHVLAGRHARRRPSRTSPPVTSAHRRPGPPRRSPLPDAAARAPPPPGGSLPLAVASTALRAAASSSALRVCTISTSVSTRPTASGAMSQKASGSDRRRPATTRAPAARSDRWRSAFRAGKCATRPLTRTAVDPFGELKRAAPGTPPSVPPPRGSGSRIERAGWPTPPETSRTVGVGQDATTSPSAPASISLAVAEVLRARAADMGAATTTVRATVGGQARRATSHAPDLCAGQAEPGGAPAWGRISQRLAHGRPCRRRVLPPEAPSPPSRRDRRGLRRTASRRRSAASGPIRRRRRCGHQPRHPHAGGEGRSAGGRGRPRTQGSLLLDGGEQRLALQTRKASWRSRQGGIRRHSPAAGPASTVARRVSEKALTGLSRPPARAVVARRRLSVRGWPSRRVLPSESRRCES